MGTVVAVRGDTLVFRAGDAAEPVVLAIPRIEHLEVAALAATPIAPAPPGRTA